MDSTYQLRKEPCIILWFEAFIYRVRHRIVIYWNRQILRRMIASKLVYVAFYECSEDSHRLPFHCLRMPLNIRSWISWSTSCVSQLVKPYHFQWISNRNPAAHMASAWTTEALDLPQRQCRFVLNKSIMRKSNMKLELENIWVIALFCCNWC